MDEVDVVVGGKVVDTEDRVVEVVVHRELSHPTPLFLRLPKQVQLPLTSSPRSSPLFHQASHPWRPPTPPLCPPTSTPPKPPGPSSPDNKQPSGRGWPETQGTLLFAGQGPRRSDAYTQARLVKERLRRWKEGEYGQLWQEAVELTKPATKARRRRGRVMADQEKSLEEKNAGRALQLAQEGQYRKSLQALDSVGMAEQTRATEEEMLRKHPPAAGPSTFQRSSDNTLQLQFSAQEVEKAALSFRKGSAPGPSGLRPEHLQIIVKGPLLTGL